MFVFITQRVVIFCQGLNVLIVEGYELFLVDHVGLLEFMGGMAAPMYWLFIYWDVHQILIELHYHDLVILRVFVEKDTNFIGIVEIAVINFFSQPVLEVIVKLKVVQYFSMILIEITRISTVLPGTSHWHSRRSS